MKRNFFIIGDGVAGLSAAYALLMDGHGVTLAELLGMYKRIHPDADITLGANQTHVIERLIEKHQVEIAVVSRMAASKTLASDPFVSMRITAFVANNNPFTKKSVIDLSELEKFPLITRGQTQGRGNTVLILAEMRKQGYRPNILMRYESPDALKTAVQNKLGIGFLFEDAIKHAIARGGFKQLRIRDLEMVGHTYIIYNKSSTPPDLTSSRARLTALKSSSRMGIAASSKRLR